MRKPLILLVIVVGGETILGHPYIRAEWRSRSGGAENAYYTRCLSITGRSYEFNGPKPYFGFLEPDRTLLASAFDAARAYIHERTKPSEGGGSEGEPPAAAQVPDRYQIPPIK